MRRPVGGPDRCRQASLILIQGCPAFVPGIRLCGHSRSVLVVADLVGNARIVTGNQPCRQAFTVRAIADKCRKSFVLLRMNGSAIRAFADQ
jgi:hypothetical protein